MELNDRDKREGYVYDVIIKQYDTSFWKSTTGTPAVSGTKLRFTSAAAASYLQHIFADVEFALNVPTTPSGGEAKLWGLLDPSSNRLGGAYFEIAGAVFKAVTYDYGGTVQSTTLTWSSYEAVETFFRIKWEADQVRFLINDVVVATHNTRVPSQALALRIINGDADNTDLGYVAVLRAAAVI